MSLTMILVPMAVALCVSSTETVLAIKEKCARSSGGEVEDIETRFANNVLLRETLTQHGVKITVHNENYIEAAFQTGKIIYHRNSENQNYKMKIVDVLNVDDLVCNLELLEKEYDSNVQSYTYNRVINNIPDNMAIESEEVMEDDSILITIAVD